MRFTTLVAANYGNMCDVEIEIVGGFIMLSFFNYETQKYKGYRLETLGM